MGDAFGEIIKSALNFLKQFWLLHMRVLKHLKCHDYFLEKGWPFVVLFFVYGFVFPPLGILYLISGIFHGGQYAENLRDKEIEELYSNDENETGTNS